MGCGAEQGRVPGRSPGSAGLAPQAPLSLGVPQPRREPRAVPEAGPQGCTAIRGPSPRAAVAEWGGCGEAVPRGGRGSSLAGGRPGGGGAGGAAQGSHYPGVITQPNAARPLRRPGAEPRGAQQTPPGAASYPQPATQDSRPQRPCPVTAWLRASVSPGSVRARGAVLEDKGFLPLQSHFASAFTGLPKLTDSDSSHMRKDPGPAPNSQEL